MLRHPMRETADKATAISVEGISYDVFRLLVAYLYTGEAQVPPHLASALLLACERYICYPLQLECALVMVQSLSADTLWEMLSVGAALQLPPPTEEQQGGAAPDLEDSEPGVARSPVEVLRDAVVRFFCESGELPRLAGADEFAMFAEDLVPRLHEVVRARMANMRMMTMAGRE